MSRWTAKERVPNAYRERVLNETIGTCSRVPNAFCNRFEHVRHHVRCLYERSFSLALIIYQYKFLSFMQGFSPTLNALLFIFHNKYNNNNSAQTNIWVRSGKISKSTKHNKIKINKKEKDGKIITQGSQEKEQIFTIVSLNNTVLSQFRTDSWWEKQEREKFIEMEKKINNFQLTNFHR